MTELPELISAPREHLVLRRDDDAVLAAGRGVAGRRNHDKWLSVRGGAYIMGDASSGKLLIKLAWYLPRRHVIVNLKNHPPHAQQRVTCI